MSIELTSNFTQQAAMALDDRFSFADITARNALAAGRRYEGMLVYVQATKLIYKLDSDLTTWNEFGTGSSVLAVTTKTNNYTSLIGDNVILLDGSSNSVTLSLITAVGNTGLIYYIKALDVSNSVDINPNASETIDGVTSNFELYTQNDSLTIVSDGSNWQIL